MSNETKATPEQQLLKALFAEYVEADTERHRVLEQLQDESGQYRQAMLRTQEAWNKYDSERERQASN